MEHKRYIETGSKSIFGEYLYDQIVHPEHFLRKWKEVINWNRFTYRIIKLYKGEGVVGRPPFDPAQVLRMELIAYLYQLTERQVEVYVNENLPAKYFVGLSVEQKAPDHSTLCVFRERLIKRGKLKVFERMLEDIIQMVLESGIEFGAIQLVESVHSIADVNTEKDKKRQEKKGKCPRDPDAQWGVKHKRKVKNEEGKEIIQTDYFYGYKTHVRLSAETGLITSLEVSSGEVYDGHYFYSLVDHDPEQKLPVNTYAGNKGYDDSDNHYYLELHGLHPTLRLKKTHTEKKRIATNKSGKN